MCIRDRCNENTNNQGIDDKVSGRENSDNYNNGITSTSDDVIENGVSESDTLNNDSNDESLMGVEVSGEVISVNELESCLLYTSRCV